MLNYSTSAKTADQLRRELLKLLETERAQIKGLSFTDKGVRERCKREGRIEQVNRFEEILRTLKIDGKDWYGDV